MPADKRLEIARPTFKIAQFGICQKLDIWMPTGIQHPGPQYSYGAIHGGESLVELSHPSAEGRRFLNQIDFHTAGGQIERRLNSGYTSAYNQNAFFSFPLWGHIVILAVCLSAGLYSAMQLPLVSV
jgi:hypothetical protein